MLGDGFKLGRDGVKDEVKRFVQAIETNYTDTIRALKDKNDKLARQLRSLTSAKAGEVSEKSEMEHLFIDCI